MFIKRQVVKMADVLLVIVFVKLMDSGGERWGRGGKNEEILEWKQTEAELPAMSRE
jgi:hypothetical protein